MAWVGLGGALVGLGVRDQVSTSELCGRGGRGGRGGVAVRSGWVGYRVFRGQAWAQVRVGVRVGVRVRTGSRLLNTWLAGVGAPMAVETGDGDWG